MEIGLLRERGLWDCCEEVAEVLVLETTGTNDCVSKLSGKGPPTLQLVRRGNSGRRFFLR